MSPVPLLPLALCRCKAELALCICSYNRLREKFPATAFAGRPALSENGFDLLNKLLTYDPQKVTKVNESDVNLTCFLVLGSVVT